MIMIRRKDARFRAGQLVRHRRYGYRGVVVDFDERCSAPDGWYQSNQTQPVRDQPWYHVLVHGAHHTTYAAEENLVEDDSATPIVHPLLEQFFVGFENGAYVRNDQPFQ